MTSEKIKRMLDACYLAKRIRELLPELPEGVTSAHIQYLDAIHVLQDRGLRVKVSDISDYFGLPRPGVTRTVKDMVQKGYLEKHTSQEDGRVTYLAVTAQGETLHRKYNTDYYRRLAPKLEHISDEEADCMISAIQKFYAVMKERSVDVESFQS